jgi:hypothetical protein
MIVGLCQKKNDSWSDIDDGYDRFYQNWKGKSHITK